MVRKTMKMLLVAVAAALALGSVAEAAPKKTVVKPRARHSSRVSSGASVTTAKKPAVTKKRVAKSRAGTAAAKKSTTAKRPTIKRKPATKPR